METRQVGMVVELTGGILLIFLALLDVFRTVLYARLGKGILSKPIARGVWGAGSTMTRQWQWGRTHLLPVCGPFIFMIAIFVWFLFFAIGMGMLIHPELGGGVIAQSGPIPTDFVTAVSVAGDSLTTVGAGDITPHAKFYRLVYLMGYLLGISIITLTITYLTEVYNALLSHNALGLKLHLATGQTGSAAERSIPCEGGMSLSMGDVAVFGFRTLDYCDFLNGRELRLHTRQAMFSGHGLRGRFAILDLHQYFNAIILQ